MKKEFRIYCWQFEIKNEVGTGREFCDQQSSQEQLKWSEQEFLKFIFIEVQFIDNVVFISAVDQSDSVINIHSLF